ncbi:MAG: L,D-transpeptidase family protein [Gammaproteobacteria bacterium]
MTQTMHVLLLLLLSWSCSAEVFNLPKNGDAVVGGNIMTKTDGKETLLDIARSNGLGYREIQLANPGIDMWVPGAGTEILLPKKFVLPMAPRNGIVINIPEMRLYYYPPAKTGEPRKVITYPLGIGREGWTTPYVDTKVIAKIKDPAWYPPASIREEHAKDDDPLPKVVGAGPDNPLGQYALRLALPSYLIHGTNKPYGIGLRVSHGCIRLYPEDIEALFKSVTVGTPVHIVNQPYKVGLSHGKFYLQANPYLDEDSNKFDGNLTSVVRMVVKLTSDNHDYQIDWDLAREVIRDARGIPVVIGHVVSPNMIAVKQQKEDAVAGRSGLALKLETNLKNR